MKFSVSSLVLALLTLYAALAGGCGSSSAEGFPACSEVDWVGRSDHAQLTGAPTFSALEIAPGDPLSIAVPVDINTDSLSVSIASVDQSAVGTGGAAETNGGLIVDVPVEDTNLAAGVYFAKIFRLEGDGTEQSAFYIADPESRYVLSIPRILGGGDFDRCVTEIAAPTFRVVSGASEEP